MKFLAIILFLASLWTPAFTADAEAPADNPAIASVLAERFPQTKVGDCDSSQHTSLRYNGAEIHFSENGVLSILGVANNGIHWNATINVSPIARCEIWSGELALDKPPALIIMAWNLDSSGDWQTAMNLILFNDQGEPMPWRASSLFHVDKNGVQEIVRMPGSANASVLVPLREGDRVNGFAYAYDLYDVVGDRLRAVDDIRNGVNWPFIPNKRQELAGLTAGQLMNLAKAAPATQGAEIQLEIKLRHKRLSTFDSDATTSSGQLKSLTRHPGDNELQLELQDGLTVGFPSILVEDNADNVRSINFQPNQEDVQKAIGDSKKVQFIGRGCLDRTCNPLIMKVVSQ